MRLQRSFFYVILLGKGCDRYLSLLNEKLKETLYSVIPITVIVLVLHLTIAPLDISVLIRFLIGALAIVIGLSVFLIGVEIGVTPIGNHMGSALTKTNRILIIIIASLILGFFISIAEPDLHILAGQVNAATAGMIAKSGIVIVVSIGIAIMLTIGMVRILYNFPLFKILTVMYILIFILSLFTSSEFLAISFDASGATTGALTVPFIMALSIGISTMKKDSKASEKDSFGLVAIASGGAILSVMLMSLIGNTKNMTGAITTEQEIPVSLMSPFFHQITIVPIEIAIALLPFLFLFLMFHFTLLKLSKRAFFKIIIGLIYTFLGLVIFMTGVNAGFMQVGNELGAVISTMNNKAIVIGVGFLLGVVSILAEPAVHILTNQIQDVTSGYVPKKAVLFALCAGVGMAVALSILRILVPGLKLWHYLLPGYVISIALMYFVPKLFVGIAFDAGGVATGPMTATFILAFTQGAASAIPGASVLTDGFGMIATVAMMPIISLQILGLIFKIRAKKRGVKNV